MRFFFMVLGKATNELEVRHGWKESDMQLMGKSGLNMDGTTSRAVGDECLGNC